MKDTVMKDYGEDVFSEKAIRAFLPKTVAAKLLATMRDGKPLDPSIADAVAAGMKDWAVDRANGEDDAFQKRIRCQTVCAVNAGSGDFAAGAP